MELNQQQTEQVKNNALNVANKNIAAKEAAKIAAANLVKEGNKPIKEINVGFDFEVDNPFKSYTDKLAQKLQEKNTDYGDSYTKGVDIYGTKTIGSRIFDKYSRLERLLLTGEQNVKDESIKDTLLDLAGYSILALKYLDEHKKGQN